MELGAVLTEIFRAFYIEAPRSGFAAAIDTEVTDINNLASSYSKRTALRLSVFNEA